MLYQNECSNRRMMAHFCSMIYSLVRDDQGDSRIDPDFNLNKRHLVDAGGPTIEDSCGSASLRRAAKD
jgi:hypothetical protein